jgi:CheY-like chemotaxis protein
VNHGRPFIQVKDDGPGIPPEVAERVFEPFFTTKGPERGTGLGLAMSREIVRRLGGDLSIDSVEGEGTIAMVFLPLCLRAQVPPPTVHRQRARLLVVDSRLERLRLIERALRHDYEILVAHSGLDALALLESGARVDGILGDVSMPQMDGHRFAGAIATHWQDGAPPVVLFGDEPGVDDVSPAPSLADEAGWLALARRATAPLPLH